LQVRPEFDQYQALRTAVEAAGGAIQMFRARYLLPQAFTAVLGAPSPQPDRLGRLRQQVQAVPGVRAVFIDPDRWFANGQGLAVGGALLFADPQPHLEDDLTGAARAAGYVLELHKDPETTLAEKESSELDHAVAGVCMLFLAGLGVLLLALPQPPSLLKHGTVLIFLVEFLILAPRSDSRYWPMGALSWWAGFHDPETVQHRLGLGLLLPIALGDFLRVRRGWKISPLLSGWGVLGVSLIGGGMLVIHRHTALDPAHMPAVRRENAEHLAMAASVLLFGVSKWVWDTWHLSRRWGGYLHLVFLGLLGVVLALYVE
jgi:hypothetical protein